MADQVQDSLLREIDEELRQEHYAKLWKKYGSYIIAFAVILVAAVGGYQGWRAWDIQTRMEQSDRFQSALELKQSGDTEAARKAFEELADDAGSGYETLSRLQEASVLEQSGDRQGAVAVYEQIAEDFLGRQAFPRSRGHPGRAAAGRDRRPGPTDRQARAADRRRQSLAVQCPGGHRAARLPGQRQGQGPRDLRQAGRGCRGAAGNPRPAPPK